MNGRVMLRYLAIFLAMTLGTGLGWAQVEASSANSAMPTGTYQPKFPGDPARSDSEAQALGYMRVVLRAQREYKKRHDKYADSLTALAGTGSFTKRMAATKDRGDYGVSFQSHKEGFTLTMTPKQLDGEHRSFYAEDDGAIHADDQKAADLGSPKIKWPLPATPSPYVIFENKRLRRLFPPGLWGIRTYS